MFQSPGRGCWEQKPVRVQIHRQPAAWLRTSRWRNQRSLMQMPSSQAWSYQGLPVPTGRQARTACGRLWQALKDASGLSAPACIRGGRCLHQLLGWEVQPVIQELYKSEISSDPYVKERQASALLSWGSHQHLLNQVGSSGSSLALTAGVRGAKVNHLSRRRPWFCQGGVRSG